MPEKQKEESVKMILELSDLPKENYRKEIERIGWNNIFLFEAWLWSSRSHDPQTQCGCVIVKNNTVLSTGYNGFIRDIDDSQLPNLRPAKYDFFIHAEHNAILNCARNGISTMGATAYITSIPCTNCLQYLWQAGIIGIVFSDINVANMVKNDKSDNIRRVLLKLIDDRLSMTYIPSIDLWQNISKLFPIKLDKHPLSEI